MIQYKSLINLDNVSSEQKPLANVLNEMMSRVDTVVDHFESLKTIAEAAKGMLYSPWTYRPLTNSIRQLTQWYLTEEQYNALFEQVNIQDSAVKFLKNQIDEAMAGIKDNQNVAAFENVLKRLNQRLIMFFQVYFNAIKDAAQLSETFNNLNPKLQTAFDAYLKQQELPVLGGIHGKSIQGAQHIGRIPLILREIAKTAKSNPNPQLAEQGRLLEEILEQIVQPTISESFSSKTKPKM